MSNEFIAFKSDETVQRVMESLREQKPEESLINYIYVVNNKNILIGKISLRDLVISQPNTTLKSIMHKDFIFMYDTDKIDEMIDMVSKYNLLAIPIVDKEMNLVGNVIGNDVIHELLKD